MVSFLTRCNFAQVAAAQCLPNAEFNTVALELNMPRETFSRALRLGDAARQIQLLWAPSETDDALVAWLPKERLLYGGAAVTPSIPNVGTPLRSLRDPVRWADTLERLARLEIALSAFHRSGVGINVIFVDGEGLPYGWPFQTDVQE